MRPGNRDGRSCGVSAHRASDREAGRARIDPAAGHGPRVLAYSHDGYGLGHLRRNLRIVDALRQVRPDIASLLVTGAKSAERLARPFGAQCIRLPAVVKVANGQYVVDDSTASLDEVMRRRSALLADVVRRFLPDLLLVDRYPLGMHGELTAALEVHRAQRPCGTAVLGLRDILDRPQTVRDEWRAQGHSDVIRDTYGTVLCYGDPTVFDPVAEYALPADVAERVRFTGYLADDLLAADALEVRRTHCTECSRLAVCTLGGGKDAAHIAHSFVSAMKRLRRRGWAGVLVTGPYMAAADVIGLRRRAAAVRVPVIRMVDDMPSYLAAADVAVCMGGYNTTCELIGLAVPAVVIPRVQPRQEQLMRAQRLAARDLLRWLHPDELSPGALVEGIERAAEAPRNEFAARVQTIAHGGLRASANYLAALLPNRAAADVRGGARLPRGMVLAAR